MIFPTRIIRTIIESISHSYLLIIIKLELMYHTKSSIMTVILKKLLRYALSLVRDIKEFGISKKECGYFHTKIIKNY